jgi:GntR family transcriptional regulator
MELRIDHSNPVPMHLQVEALLRRLIALPKYQQGAFLPPEVELAKQLGISRNTVRQATNKLEHEGLIVRKKGVGTKAAAKTVTTQLDSWHSFTQEMNDKGIAFRNFRIEARWEEASELLARFFNLPAKTPVVRLVRLRGDADGPFVYFESYFHPRTGISPEEDFSRPLYELLETKHNSPVKLPASRSGQKKRRRALPKCCASRPASPC